MAATCIFRSLLAILFLTGAMVLGGCERDEERTGMAPPGNAAQDAAQDRKSPGAEGARTLPATNDVVYLTNLALMRGHLIVGMELYEAGALEQARTHMKHPESELYSALEPALAARGTPGFARELERLAAAVEGDADPAEVEAAWAELRSAMEVAENAVNDGEDPRAAKRLKVIVAVMKEAANEYEIGVKNGAVVNVHEYQDAYGFTRAARRIVASIDPGQDEALAETLAQTGEELRALEPAWPGLVEPGAVEADASLLRDAASQIEERVESLE